LCFFHCCFPFFMREAFRLIFIAAYRAACVASLRLGDLSSSVFETLLDI
jgi:hypothetical protein